MRQGEIMNLRWHDVDLQQNQIVLHETKNGEKRVVPLVHAARDEIHKHSRVRRLDSELLFPSKGPRSGRRERATVTKPMDLRFPFLEALKAAEVEDFRFHDLRHSAASELAMNGATSSEIAQVLGHKTFQMVKRYAHLSNDHTRKVLASMNEKIFS
jgi:integrase